MVNETVAEALCNDFLQRFQLGVDEFNNFAGLDVDEVIVMRLWRRFIARAPVTKIVAVQYARFFEQADSPIYGGD